MKKQILALMACAAFLTPTSGVCMDIDDEEITTPMQRVLNCTELGVRILSHLHLPKGYSIRLVSSKEELDQIKYGELAVFLTTRQNLHYVFCKIAEKKEIQVPIVKFSHSGNGIDKDCLQDLLGVISSKKKENELWPRTRWALLGYADAQSYPLQDLKNIENVSKRFCILRRDFITSIKTPSWATDEDLINYTSTLSKLNELRIVSGNFTAPDEKGLLYEIPGPITDRSIKRLAQLRTLHLGSDANITDESLTALTNLKELYLLNNKMITNNGLKTLTNLTTLSLARCNITSDGIENLKNLTCLDSQHSKKTTDDWLIDSSNKLKHPKLKLLMLPATSEHKISEEAQELLEKNGVVVKENEYNFLK